MTASRYRLTALVAIALTAGLLFLSWSQTWFALQLPRQSVVVAGSVAASALPPLALVSLAMILALALAGTGFRIVLGVLEALVGVGVIAVTAFALGDPAVASAPTITKALGLTGSGTAAYVRSTAVTGWPIVAIVAGALGILVGAYIVATARRWPATGRRFTRTRTEAAPATDPVREWDALSEGDDPTRPEP